MKTINAHTKISALINAHPGAIDAIISINPHFRKLKNPVLRKILASRVTIADAAKIGKCTVQEFFDRLQPLGFIIDHESAMTEQSTPLPEEPGRPFNVRLDVRADIEQGHDPFKKIMKQLSDLPAGEVLLLVNSFEPVPLIRILKDRGYTAEVAHVHENVVYTYFGKKGEGVEADATEYVNPEAFEVIAEKYENKMEVIDVRHLPMPQPMVTILAALRQLPAGMALFVHHKKLPRFLLPELKEQQYELVYQPAADGIKLIIYKEEQV